MRSTISGCCGWKGRSTALARRAAEDLAAHAPAASAIALVAFGSKVVTKTELSESGKVLTEYLASFGPKYEAPEKLRRTALVDAIVEGVAVLAPPAVGDAIYVVSDGGDNSSRARRADMEKALLASGIRFFAFGTTDPIAQRIPPDLVWGVTLLKNTAELTGGAALVVEGFPGFQEQLEAIAARARFLYEQMGEFYQLEVELPVGVAKPQGWKLEVVKPDGKRRKDVEVAYPRKLVPCAVPGGKGDTGR